MPDAESVNATSSTSLHHDSLLDMRKQPEMLTDIHRGKKETIDRGFLEPPQVIERSTNNEQAVTLASCFVGCEKREEGAQHLLPQCRRASILQQMRKEKYSQRELLVMNTETPPRSQGNSESMRSIRRDKCLPAAIDITDEPGEDPTKSKHTASESGKDCGMVIKVSDQDSKPPLALASHETSHQQRFGERHSIPAPTEYQNEYRFFFVSKGRDMHPPILVGPKEIAKRRGAQVIEQFDPTKPPTHFIVSCDPSLSTESVALALGFSSVEDLRDYVRQNHIITCKRDWITHATAKSFAELRSKPGANHIYIPLFCGPGTPNKTVLATTRNRRERQDSDASLDPVPKRNLGVSRMLEKLSKLYGQAPLDKIDLWRSYCFQLIAGRVRLLDYDLTSENVNELRHVKGVGSSILALVKDYLGHLEATEGDGNDDMLASAVDRISHLQNDPQRKALREMCQIWGVGRETGMELIRAGYYTFAHVKSDFENGKFPVVLSRNQCIGLLCYDDLLEKMDDVEVAAISEIVKGVVHARFPNAQIETLGSYRRQKGSYGDVDFLITHPKYVTNVPPKALGMIVQDLRRLGHIAFHLTWMHGMDAGEFDESIPESVIEKISGGQYRMKNSESDSTSSCSSYMGIFVSPTSKKLRRIDIKFYPSSERIFALLYFTGNGHFNRSMRLWSLRKFGWTLNDHGLFERGTNIRVMVSVRAEHDVFQKLKLVWKEPCQRDSFDGVCGIDQVGRYVVSSLEGFSDREFKDEAIHPWIA